MRDLAEELGHSATFPTPCRYCGELIYLYANPNGGFAIFDELGKPWPRHECWGVGSDTRRYSTTGLTCSPDYRFPIPQDTQFRGVSPGDHISGTVISEDTGVGKIANAVKAHIFDGNWLYSLHLPRPIPLGMYLKGSAGIIGGVPTLKPFEVLHLVGIESFLLSEVEGWARPTEVSTLQQSDIWDLQTDAMEMEALLPETATFLREALNALLNGFTLTGICLLVEVVRTQSDKLPTRIKAKHIETLFRSLLDLRLEPCAPTLFSQLSKGTRRTLDENTRKLVQKVVGIGELRRKLETPSRVRSALQSRLRKENKYIEGLSKHLPQIIRVWPK